MRDLPITGVISNCWLFRYISLWKLSLFNIGQIETMSLMNMKGHKIQQRIQIIKIDYKDNENLAQTIH